MKKKTQKKNVWISFIVAAVVVVLFGWCIGWLSDPQEQIQAETYSGQKAKSAGSAVGPKGPNAPVDLTGAFGGRK